MTLVNTATGEITETITREDHLASIDTALRGLAVAAEQIIWQVENRTWDALGYDDWDTFRQEVYGGAAVMVPTGSRERITQRLKSIPIGATARGGDKYLTNADIASTLGVSEATVENDLGSRKSRKSTGFVDTDPEPEDVIEAELVEDEPASPKTSTEAPPADHGLVMWSQARYVLDDLATKKYSLVKVRAAHKKTMLRDLETLTEYIKENI